MTEKVLPIEVSRPSGPSHALASSEALAGITKDNAKKQEVVPLVDYLKGIAALPRGTEGEKKDLNSHLETFILKEGKEIKLASLEELQRILREGGLNVEVLGVHEIANKKRNQVVTSVVQGVNRADPKSGFERPTVAEGAHMILAPYAVDKNGEIHLFRSIQMRTGQAMIDTARGFADAKALENGDQMYEVDKAGDKVKANMTRIVGEESGDALQIKKIKFLGAPRVNSAFVTSQSAIFAVEVDYDAFIKSKKVISNAELKRRREQFEHEGLVGDVLDFTLSEYLNYKKDSQISKDMAADFGTDTVVMDFLARNLEKSKASLSKLGEMRRKFKKDNPVAYAQHMATEAKYANPKNIDEIDRRAQAYLSGLYQTSLRERGISTKPLKK